MRKVHTLSVGPIVGHTSSSEARIWGRAQYEADQMGKPRRIFGVVRFRESNEITYMPSVVFKMNPNFDMTGIACIQRLTPSTGYNFQIGWFYSEGELEDFERLEWDWSDADEGAFSTASDKNGDEREFVFGSCRYLLKLFGGNWFDDRGDKTFRSIKKMVDMNPAISKFLMVGDQIYADDLNFVAPDIEAQEYLARYRDAFSQPGIRRLMSTVSTYMILDDHEIENNWPESSNQKDMLVKYPAAMHAYQSYQASHSPLFSTTPGGRLTGTAERYYYTFSDGCCDFFIADTRTERDYQCKEIIGERQLGELLDWLGDGSKRVKLIVTSVPFFPDPVKQNGDKWVAYLNQRDRILESIRLLSLNNVVFLSGDIHCSLTAELQIGAGLKTYSVISSPFFWPYPRGETSSLQFSTSVGTLLTGTSFPVNLLSPVISGNNFTKVKVSPSGIDAEVYERKGALKSQSRIRF